MTLNTIVDSYKIGRRQQQEGAESARSLSLFSEQYLEKPVMKGVYHAFRSPTMCTIKGVPAIDDF